MTTSRFVRAIYSSQIVYNRVGIVSPLRRCMPFWCGEGKLVSRVHTLVERSAQVVYELQLLEEEEKVREEVQDIERRVKVRRNAQMTMTMWME